MSDAKVERLRQTALQELQWARTCRDAQLADEVDVADGYTLIREGTFGEQFILIIDGHVRIDRGGQTVRVMGPGEFLGEIARSTRAGRRPRPRRTDRPSCSSSATLHSNSLLDESPAIRLEIMTALANRVRQLDPTDTPLN